MSDATRLHEPDDFVQSVGRALRILEVVSGRPGLPVKAIARRCGLNLSTTYHLARTLWYQGYLERRADGTYVTGPQVASRFYEMLSALGRPPTARSVLRCLAEQTGMSAYLGRINAGQVTVVDYAEGPRSPYLEEFERGLNVSAHATALGKALLVGLSGRDRRAFLRDQEIRAYTANTVTDLSRLEAELSRVPPTQVIVEHGEFRDGVACAARFIGDGGDGGPLWALAVSCRGDDVPPGGRRELALAAAELSAR